MRRWCRMPSAAWSKFMTVIPTRTERHALAQSRRPMGMTRYSLRSENPGMSQPSRGLVLVARFCFFGPAKAAGLLRPTAAATIVAKTALTSLFTFMGLSLYYALANRLPITAVASEHDAHLLAVVPGSGDDGFGAKSRRPATLV